MPKSTENNIYIDEDLPINILEDIITKNATTPWSICAVWFICILSGMIIILSGVIGLALVDYSQIKPDTAAYLYILVPFKEIELKFASRGLFITSVVRVISFIFTTVLSIVQTAIIIFFGILLILGISYTCVVILILINTTLNYYLNNTYLKKE